MVSTGVNFINNLWAAFALVDPKSVKRCWRLDWILTLFGSYERKYVDKIDHRTPKMVWKRVVYRKSWMHNEPSSLLEIFRWRLRTWEQTDRKSDFRIRRKKKPDKFVSGKDSPEKKSGYLLQTSKLWKLSLFKMIRDTLGGGVTKIVWFLNW